jgi:hypothetical protein
MRQDHAIPAVDIRHSRAFNHSWDAANAAADPEVKFLSDHPLLPPHASFWAEWSPDLPASPSPLPNAPRERGAVAHTLDGVVGGLGSGVKTTAKGERK